MARLHRWKYGENACKTDVNTLIIRTITDELIYSNSSIIFPLDMVENPDLKSPLIDCIYLFVFVCLFLC